MQYVTDGPARGWLHTHGLASHGQPELELRRIPVFLRRHACALLNEIADYLLNDSTAPLLPGNTMLFGDDVILFLAPGPDEEAGYASNHYDGCVRLCLVDPPPRPCDCEHCAKELAGGTRLPS